MQNLLGVSEPGIPLGFIHHQRIQANTGYKKIYPEYWKKQHKKVEKRHTNTTQPICASEWQTKNQSTQHTQHKHAFFQ